ncbi:hypothetical protein HPB49_011399 [Dermacentor silvarum]|uniref:Uncharacterized protein n=1 Tax=Dermacentor silvarum TaxID=543639 RepID=A0ACB8D530_DERSI|nr:hypothetical protein HPB49_011399 [Dermacentor silvarum]
MTPTPVSLRCSDGQNERPVDKCWGIPVFAALSTLIITLPGSYMAVLFVFFVDDYNVSRERASWPQNSLTMATHVSGLLVAALQRRISVANIAILGALLASLGVIASAFAREVIWMSISLGVMYGLGIGMFMASCGYPYPYALRQVQGYRLDARIRCMGAGNKSNESGPTAFVEPVLAEDILPSRKHSFQQEGSRAFATSPLPFSARLAFYVFLVATVAGDYSGVSFNTTIVDYAVDKGIDVGVATHLVEFGAVGHLLGRIFIMPLSDWAPISRLPLFASSYALEAICALIVPHIGSSFGQIVTLRVAETTITGFSTAIRGILLAQYMGVDRLASCMGLYGLVMIPVSLGSASIIGFFRDTMGSYDGFYRMLAALNTVVAVLLGMFLVFDWTRTKRRGSQSSENSLTHVTIGRGMHSEQRC